MEKKVPHLARDTTINIKKIEENELEPKNRFMHTDNNEIG
jgi:hypothetical protein